MGLSRRLFLKYSVSGAAVLGTGGLSALLSACSSDSTPPVSGTSTPASATSPTGVLSYEGIDPRVAENFTTPLRKPGTEGLFGILDLGAGPLTLSADSGKMAIFGDRSVPVRLYNSQSGGRNYQNPVLKISKDLSCDVTFRNNLDQPTTVHWHGLLVPGSVDGSPLNPVAPGASYSYKFSVNNRGGTYWYHPHPHMHTAEQTFAGLSSFFIVEDAHDLALRQAMNLTLGDTELPLLIQDRRCNEEGELDYSPDDMEKMMGYFGNVMLVNFTPNPALDVDTRFYRFRVLNGSSIRTYKLAFENNGNPLKFHVVGTDGGLLDKPYEVPDVYLAAAERVDIVLDLRSARPGDVILLKSLAFDPKDTHMPSPAFGTSLKPGEAFTLMKLVVRNLVDAGGALPATLSSLPALPSASDKIRTLQPARNASGDWVMKIDGVDTLYDMNDFPIVVKKNAVEFWDFKIGSAGMPHPIHLHGFLFRVLSRTGTPPEVAAQSVDASGRMVTDLGFKDTVLVWPGETVRVAIDFHHCFGAEEHYMVHCHVLEHEDMGLMTNVKVIA
ncbi:multicopper oxidase domain-containing protein [Thermithiobacillus plumbiphilus]|uniref:Multicopper oxidase CueO n=2 Tax=Thermithiobacillus plumbiphilus TaxID=1729899 RepID=A0ABU9D761_9PROT